MNPIPGLTLVHRGKVRDTYKLDSRTLLVVATNRLSTHNIVHESIIPGKGEILTALSVFWTREVLGDYPEIETHLEAAGSDIYQYLPPSVRARFPKLHHRAVVVRQLEMFPVEFIYRGYLAGSLYDKFYVKGKENPYDIEIPPGLPLMHRFDEVIFTPTDKSETDEPLPAEEVATRFPGAVALAEKVYTLIRAYANQKGIEIVDTKLELGKNGYGETVLADEIVTPDSSRFVELSAIKEGENPPWLDKQLLRDEAEKIWAGGPKRPLAFPSEIVEKSVEKYGKIFSRLTGFTLEEYQRDCLD